MLIGSVLVIRYAMNMTRVDPARPAVVAPPTTAPATGALTDPLDSLMELAGSADALADGASGGMPGVGGPLDHEPAHLPALRTGTQLTRFRRDGDGYANEYAVWEFAGKKSAWAASFYTEAAEAAGFRLIDEATLDSSKVIRRTFTRGNERLVVRARQTGDAVRLVLHLRYTLHGSRTDRPADPHG